MKIDRVIARMQELRDAGETDVAIAWWSRTDYYEHLTQEQFEVFADEVDDMDWSDTNDQMNYILDELGFDEESEEEEE